MIKVYESNPKVHFGDKALWRWEKKEWKCRRHILEPMERNLIYYQDAT